MAEAVRDGGDDAGALGDGPLAGVTVLDFSTLLPGPLATLMLAEAGADVIKVEHPDGGDPIRRVEPFADDGMSVRFLMLNRGKRSIVLDLKSASGRERARSLAREADVLVEQFRPGVMERLGLGYEALAIENPKLVYCSITGYGQTGPKADLAGHDLNYAAETGLLSLVHDPAGAPRLPAATYADIGGGSYPAVINILLALARRARTGRGARIDVAMAENLFPFAYAGIGAGFRGRWPVPDAELLTGASPRYALYATADGRHLAVAALEERFWQQFCAAIALPEAVRNDGADPQATRQAVAERIFARSATEWETTLAGMDVCVSVVRNLAEAVNDPHVVARGIFARRVGLEGAAEDVAAMHVPLDPNLRSGGIRRDAPTLANSDEAAA